jgi:AbrB family looped-hinge helix DNA binding protein
MSKNTVTVSEKGAIVIPKEIRERYGIGPGDRVQVLDWAGRISLVKVPSGDPVKWGRGLLKGWTTEEVLEEKRRELEEEERDLPRPRPLE